MRVTTQLLFLLQASGLSAEAFSASAATSSKDSTVQSLPNEYMSTQPSMKTDCHAKKAVDNDAAETMVFTTTTVILPMNSSSGIDNATEEPKATIAVPSTESSSSSSNGSSHASVLNSATAVGYSNNDSHALSSSALYPVNMYEVPYAVMDGNTSYIDTSIAYDRGLSFLVSAFSSAGKTYTSNLGIMLAEPTPSTAWSSYHHLTPSQHSNAARTKSTNQESATTTVFLDATLTLTVKSTTTSVFTAASTSLEDDSRVTNPSSSVDKHQVRHPKDLFKPKPFADLRTHLQSIKPAKERSRSDIKDHKNNSTSTSLQNAGPVRLAPAIPAMVAIALAVVLASNVSFSSTSSSTATSTTIFQTDVPPPVHILNSIITPSPSFTTKISEAPTAADEVQPAFETSEIAASGPWSAEAHVHVEKRKGGGGGHGSGGGGGRAGGGAGCLACAGGASSTGTLTSPPKLCSPLALITGLLMLVMLVPSVSGTAVINLEASSLSGNASTTPSATHAFTSQASDVAIHVSKPITSPSPSREARELEPRRGGGGRSGGAPKPG